MHNAEPILGPFIFFIYSLFVLLIMVNLMIAIITDVFRQIRKEAERAAGKDGELDAGLYLIGKVKRFFGIGKDIMEENIRTKFVYVAGE